jgi:hypothetical protein
MTNVYFAKQHSSFLKNKTFILGSFCISYDQNFGNSALEKTLGGPFD